MQTFTSLKLKTILFFSDLLKPKDFIEPNLLFWFWNIETCAMFIENRGFKINEFLQMVCRQKLQIFSLLLLIRMTKLIELIMSFKIVFSNSLSLNIMQSHY